MDFSPEKLDASVQAMKLNYPTFSVGGRPIGTGAEAVWKGWIQPIRSLEDLQWILADIEQNRSVRILQGGEVIHDPSCRRKHQELKWIEKLKKPDRAFKIKISYGGGKRHPRGHVIEPLIPIVERKHMFGDNAVCAYSPWENVWNWEAHTVSDFADQVVLWLIKWNVWQQTGVWLGDEMQHGKMFLYFTIAASDQCWCGSGRQYGECHRQEDEREVLRNLFALSESKKYGL